ncbi:MAG: hypothetical protein AB1725_09560 [Armatimonadota bacterium]
MQHRPEGRQPGGGIRIPTVLWNEFTSPGIPTSLAILAIVAGFYLDDVFWPSIGSGVLGLALGIVVERWSSDVDTIVDLTKQHVPPEERRRTWMILYLPAFFIVSAWLMMLGLCALLGPIDPNENDLLRGGIYICAFVTGRHVVHGVALWRRYASQSRNESP